MDELFTRRRTCASSSGPSLQAQPAPCENDVNRSMARLLSVRIPVRIDSLRANRDRETACFGPLDGRDGQLRTMRSEPTSCRVIGRYDLICRVIHHHPGFQQVPSSPLGGLLLFRAWMLAGFSGVTDDLTPDPVLLTIQPHA